MEGSTSEYYDVQSLQSEDTRVAGALRAAIEARGGCERPLRGDGGLAGFGSVGPQCWATLLLADPQRDRAVIAADVEVDERMNRALLQLYRHKTWATLRLIEHCQSLDQEDLDSTTPGTYGSIRETLRHLVGSDEDYLSQLTGIPVSDPLPEGPVFMNDLAERIRRSGSRWEALAEDRGLEVRVITAPDGWHFPGAVLMAQAAHHADDHRTHVLSILGARGLEFPRIDVWGYAMSHDLLWEPRIRQGG